MLAQANYTPLQNDNDEYTCSSNDNRGVVSASESNLACNSRHVLIHVERIDGFRRKKEYFPRRREIIRGWRPSIGVERVRVKGMQEGQREGG